MVTWLLLEHTFLFEYACAAIGDRKMPPAKKINL
jgi:hypothetical protein